MLKLTFWILVALSCTWGWLIYDDWRLYRQTTFTILGWEIIIVTWVATVFAGFKAFGG